MASCDSIRVTAEDARDVEKNIYKHVKDATAKEIKKLIKKYAEFGTEERIFMLGFARYSVPVFEFWEKKEKMIPGWFLKHAKDCKTLYLFATYKFVRNEPGSILRALHERTALRALELGCVKTYRLIVSQYPDMQTNATIARDIEVAAVNKFGAPVVKALWPDPADEDTFDDWISLRRTIMKSSSRVSLETFRHVFRSLPASEKANHAYSLDLHMSFQNLWFLTIRKQEFVRLLRQMGYAEHPHAAKEFDEILKLPGWRRVLENPTLILKSGKKKKFEIPTALLDHISRFLF